MFQFSIFKIYIYVFSWNEHYLVFLCLEEKKKPNILGLFFSRWYHWYYISSHISHIAMQDLVLAPSLWGSHCFSSLPRRVPWNCLWYLKSVWTQRKLCVRIFRILEGNCKYVFKLKVAWAKQSLHFPSSFRWCTPCSTAGCFLSANI